jgi:hypothetical protein
MDISMISIITTRCHRSSESIFYRPPIFKSLMESPSIYSKSFRPLCLAKRITSKCNKFILSCISSLNFLSNPTAVIGRIPLRIILSIQQHVFRSLSHVFGKRFKGVIPSIANFYSTSTIGWISRIRFSLAPISHTSPSIVQARVRHSVVFQLFTHYPYYSV